MKNLQFSRVALHGCLSSVVSKHEKHLQCDCKYVKSECVLMNKWIDKHVFVTVSIVTRRKVGTQKSFPARKEFE